MVEKQMRSAILEIGSFWYSAWVDAGQPELKDLVKIDLEPEEKQMQENVEKKYRNGIPIGREL
ncbi:hypothetical protein [Pedobacter sp. Leaf194]|uniref:hypothetical protein n=1 Tax=Pedobacter sp. Leaf194 TaxID=1736297 RepID=UPI001F167175|nr:hypothetical protein [Pedobacter sp. Leaf194]